MDTEIGCFMKPEVKEFGSDPVQAFPTMAR
jgi:hypothetical protein